MTRPAGASRDVLAIRTLGLDWGIAGDDIEEIVPHRTAVRAPGSAPFVEGIVRYRDGILPVVDLSRRFRLPAGAEPPPPPRPEARRTLVVRISGGLAGLTVDEVVGSRPVGAGGLAPLPRPVTSPIVRGCLVGDGEDLLVVLDARRILETDEPLDLPLPPGRRLGTAAESDTAARPGARVDPAPSRPASGARPAAPEPDAPAGPAPTPAAGNLDRPARPAVPPPPAHAARPPAPDAPPADRARPARPERGAGEYASTLPDAPSPSPTREPAAAARGAAREPAHPAPGATRESAPTPPAPARAAQSAPPGSPPVRREPGARPDSPPPRPEHPPAARPGLPPAPAAPRPAAGPGEAWPAEARPAPSQRPAAAFARREAAGRGDLPGAPVPPPRTAPGAAPDRPEEPASHGTRRPGRWIAAAAALLMVLGAAMLLATRTSRETPRPVAVRMPAGGVPAALPVAPSPLPAGTMPVTPPSSPPARESAGVAARSAPAGPSPSPAREPAGAPQGAERLVLTLEERGIADREADGVPAETIEEVVDYTVVRGDTLWHIARRFTRNPFRYREIASDNDLRNPHLIFPGQRLTLRIRRLVPAPSPSP